MSFTDNGDGTITDNNTGLVWQKTDGGEMSFENAEIYLRGTNLLTFAKEKNLEYDPETGADGMTRFTTPPVKSIVFGINLNF